MTRGRRIRIIAAAIVLSVAVAVLALVGPGVVDRVAHPGRYATSGRTRLPAGTYLAAALGRAGVGARIGRLSLPAGGAPVIVSIWPSTEIYLDPPTARVLDVAAGRAAKGAPPIAGAQPVERVIVRARPYGGGGQLRGIAWPTERSPDWTVRFGDAGAAVKVADDSGTARAAPARRQGGATALVARWHDGHDWSVPLRGAIVLGAVVAAILALVVLVGPARR